MADKKNNTGHRNTGYCNTGNYNTGDCNTGYRNTGHYNTGHYNTGDYNTGYRNTGHCNTGNYNTGHYNTGYCNTGNYNTGDYNTGHYNTGFFCTATPSPMFFDKATGLTHDEACAAIPYVELPVGVEFVPSDKMTDAERADNPTHVTIGGYLKPLCKTVQEAFPIAWAKMDQATRDRFLNLPNFDAEKFYQCTGVDVRA